MNGYAFLWPSPTTGGLRHYRVYGFNAASAHSRVRTAKKSCKVKKLMRSESRFTVFVIYLFRFTLWIFKVKNSSQTSVTDPIGARHEAPYLTLVKLRNLVNPAVDPIGLVTKNGERKGWKILNLFQIHITRSKSRWGRFLFHALISLKENLARLRIK